MPTFSQQSADRLATCDPRLQAIFNEVVKRIDCTILEGHRGQEAQEKAFAEGKSKKHWPEGNHNSMPSRAVDAWPYVAGVGVDWKDVIAAGRLMGYVQRVAEQMGIKLRFGLDWDGDWHSAGRDPGELFLDAPHVELAEP